MKRLIAIVLSLLLTATQVWAVPTFVDADAATGGDIDGTLTLSFDATGSDFLIGCVADQDLAETLNSFTYNGDALTHVATATNTDGGLRMRLYQLIAPDLGGPHNLVATWTDVVTAHLGVMSFSGVHQSVPLNTANQSGNGAVGDEVSVVVNSAVDELVAACFRFNDPAETVTLGSGETERWALTVVNTGSTKAGGSPTVTMQRLWDASSQFPALVAVSIKPAAAVSDNRRVIVIQ